MYVCLLSIYLTCVLYLTKHQFSEHHNVYWKEVGRKWRIHGYSKFCYKKLCCTINTLYHCLLWCFWTTDWSVLKGNQATARHTIVDTTGMVYHPEKKNKRKDSISLRTHFCTDISIESLPRLLPYFTPAHHRTTLVVILSHHLPCVTYAPRYW